MVERSLNEWALGTLERKGEKTGENHDTPKRGPDPPNQGRDTNRRRTRGVTALAAKKQHQAVDFVSGGTMENDDAR